MNNSLKIGKITETVLKRAVLNQIRRRRNEVLLGPAIGEDCGIIDINNNEVITVSSDPVAGVFQDIGVYAVHTAANDIAACGAEIIGITLTVLLPENTCEDVLKALVWDVESVCRQLDIDVLGGHTEVTKAVNQPIITVTGIGKLNKNEIIKTSGAIPGQEIVMTKWAGLEGTAILSKAKEQELLTKYPSGFIDDAKRMIKFLSVIPEARIAKQVGASSMHDVSKGGIFGALWEIGVASKVGMEVDLQKIMLRQETVEICEFYDLNPYMLVSGGCMLIVTDHGNLLVDRLKDEGITAAVIGRINEGNDRIIINGEERRFLEPPKADELHKVL